MCWNIWKRKSKKNLQSHKRLNDIRIFLHFLNSKISDNKLSACILTGTLIFEDKTHLIKQDIDIIVVDYTSTLYL